MNILLKICGKCKIEKNLYEFNKDKYNKDGLHGYCKMCVNTYRKAYYEKHKKESNAYSKKYSRKHKAENKIYQTIYRQKHKSKIRKLHNSWQKNRLKTHFKFRLNRNMSSGIWQSLKTDKGGISWNKYVDYTLDDLIKRLKSTLPKGYTWGDYIKGANLHIDHIIPKSKFNITSMECTDFKRCWALKNLQLLPALENMQKGVKLDKPFQPSLGGF